MLNFVFNFQPYNDLPENLHELSYSSPHAHRTNGILLVRCCSRKWHFRASRGRFDNQAAQSEGVRRALLVQNNSPNRCNSINSAFRPHNLICCPYICCCPPQLQCNLGLYAVRLLRQYAITFICYTHMPHAALETGQVFLMELFSVH